MDLPSTLGVPRIVYLGGRVFWVRPITLEAMAIILAWLDDVLPGRAEREALPMFDDEASNAALTSPLGQSILIWLALRDQEISFEDAKGIYAESSDIEHVQFINVFFGRRRTRKKSGIPSDVSETWCDKGFVSLVTELGFDQVRSLSLDQFEWLGSGGECDAHADPQVKRTIDIHKKWQEDHEKWKIEQPEEYAAWKATQEIATPEQPIAKPEYVIAAGNGEVNNA